MLVKLKLKSFGRVETTRLENDNYQKHWAYQDFFWNIEEKGFDSPKTITEHETWNQVSRNPSF